MNDSVVWYSQQITASLGKQRFADYVRAFQYGNADVSGDAEHDGLTLSWIDSSLRISPLEQLAFLDKVVNRRLGVSEHAYAMTTRLTRYNKLADGWRVHGKTGSAADLGWYVGWVSKGRHTYVFARLIQEDATRQQVVPAGVLARDSFLQEFPSLAASLALNGK